MNRSTRRQFALEAAAAATVANRGSAHTMPDSSGLDPVKWTQDRYRSAPLRLTFRATNRADAEKWQRDLRAKVNELLGGFPERTPLRPETLDVRQYGGYRRERIVFHSRPGVAVVGYLLTPIGRKPPYSTVVAIPGHGRGVDDIVGIDEHGRDRTGKPGYQHDFAIQAVEQGLAVVAIEPMGFGYRRDERTRAKGADATACQPVAGSALLFGETMIGWRVWDVMRSIDWIGTRPELDAARVGCMGISGGGTCTLFSTALDSRIKAAFVSGYLNTFRDSIMAVSHCIDNYVPGILNWAENYDIAGLIAPRPLFSEGGDRDPIFPVGATRESFARVKKVYEVFGAGPKVQQEIFEGEHVFHGVRGLPFLVDALS
ncbi:MAG: alpha/beta hydrolase family protein [Acidobacteriota bacterium]|nr:alpha/beta hydrolase family protein [Acidobacteriota bacterium]